jgi:hypothetical protein
VITTEDLTALLASWHRSRKTIQDKAYQLRKNKKEAEFSEGVSQGWAYAIDALEKLIVLRGGK